VDLYTLTNRNGLVAKITNLAGRLTELHVLDRNGQMADIVLGHSTLEPYLDHKTNPLLRLDRRYANRITKGKFTLDGKQYTLDASSGAGAIQLELPADLSASRSGFPATPSARAIRSSSAAVTRASIAGVVSR
jgi:Aldose 1-epimerase